MPLVEASITWLLDILTMLIEEESMYIEVPPLTLPPSEMSVIQHRMVEGRNGARRKSRDRR